MQYTASRRFRLAQAILGVLTWPVVWPLAMLSRRSDIVFRTMSELLAFVPHCPGVIVRYEFYRFALTRCGRNVLIEFGTIFIERDVSVGDYVWINRYTVVHHCDVGDYVLIGERCTLLSGSRQHNFERTDIPMALQGGHKKRITIGDDSWIGCHSVVTEDVGTGAIIGAGSVVTRPVPPFTMAVGSPARAVGRRDAVRD